MQLRASVSALLEVCVKWCEWSAGLYLVVDGQEGQEGHWELLQQVWVQVVVVQVRPLVVVRQRLHLGIIRERLATMRTNLHQRNSHRLRTCTQRRVRNTAMSTTQTWRKWWRQPKIRSCHDLWCRKLVNARSLDITCISKSRRNRAYSCLGYQGAGWFCCALPPIDLPRSSALLRSSEVANILVWHLSESTCILRKMS